MARLSKTSERLIPMTMKSAEDHLLYLRHLFAYELAKQEIPAGSTVLEVGSGEGYGTSLLSQHVMRITGLDVDQGVIDHATEKYGSGNCSFSVYDGNRIPFEAGTFDAVVSFQVIEHVREDRNYILEIHRVLKKGGILVLTTPNGTHRLKPDGKPFNKFHIREYLPGELEALLKPCFGGQKVSGISGSSRVMEIETARIRMSLKLMAADRLNLRKLLPGWIKQPLLKMLKRPAAGTGEDVAPNDSFSLEDFMVTRSDVSGSLDLLAICRK
jgi:SAM-dependent methyltransferase